MCADVLDELVWEEVISRLQDPALVLEAYQKHQTHHSHSADEASSTERIDAQIKFANKEEKILDNPK